MTPPPPSVLYHLKYDLLEVRIFFNIPLCLSAGTRNTICPRSTVCPRSLDPYYILSYYVHSGSRFHGHTVLEFVSNSTVCLYRKYCLSKNS